MPKKIQLNYKLLLIFHLILFIISAIIKNILFNFWHPQDIAFKAYLYIFLCFVRIKFALYSFQ